MGKRSSSLVACHGAAYLLLFIAISSMLCLAASTPLAAANQLDSQRAKRNVYGYEREPETDMLNLEPLDYELAQAAYRLSQKRGLDLGLSRGFSGNQAAKHMLGLAAANSHHVPGKRSVRQALFN